LVIEKPIGFIKGEVKFDYFEMFGKDVPFFQGIEGVAA